VCVPKLSVFLVSSTSGCAHKNLLSPENLRKERDKEDPQQERREKNPPLIPLFPGKLQNLEIHFKGVYKKKKLTK
jgi:hypothetical protein